MRSSSLGLRGLRRLSREDFLELIRKLVSSDVSRLVEEKIKYFMGVDKSSPKEVMKELAYCILTANSKAEVVLEIESEIGEKYLELDLNEIREVLVRHGYRFPNVRSRYIVDARGKLDEILKVINSGDSVFDMRTKLVRIVKGFGYKEASHFLRNIGFFEVAIIDRHILRLLYSYGLVNNDIKVTPIKYLSIERVILGLADELGMAPGILDLYMWYLSTGKVLK